MESKDTVPSTAENQPSDFWSLSGESSGPLCYMHRARHRNIQASAPSDSPLLSNGPTKTNFTSSTNLGNGSVQPIDINPAILGGNDGWFFSDRARSLLQKTKLLSPFSTLEAQDIPDNEGSFQQNGVLVTPSPSNETCYSSTITNTTSNTIASPHDKCRTRKAPRSEDELSESVGHRPPTPELSVALDPEDPAPDLPFPPRNISLREPRPQRSTSYLGAATTAEKGHDNIVPKEYRFDDEKQAYLHEDNNLQIFHNLTCAVDLNYEPSTSSPNITRYFLTVRRKQAYNMRKTFHGLRSHLHKSTGEADMIDLVIFKTSSGDRKAHRDVMVPWLEPSEKYPNSEIYDKYRANNFPLIHPSPSSDSVGGTSTKEGPFFELQSVVDLRRHPIKDVDFFLCFLYNHVKKDDFKTANLGAMSLIALDVGLYKLHQIVEQIIRDNIVGPDPLHAMSFAASAGLYWLHVAAFDYLSSNFYYYQDSDHFSKWSVDSLEIYIKSDQLRVKSELDVFLVVLNWLSANNKANIAHAGRLLNCIRFFRMTTEEIYDCLALNAQFEIFQFSEMQLLLTIHLLIQDYVRQGCHSPIAPTVPAERVVETLSHWDPRLLYADVGEAKNFLRMPEPFIQETIVRETQREEREAKEWFEATEKAKAARQKQEETVRDEEERLRKLFEMMGISTEGRSQHTIEMLRTRDLQRLIPFMEPRHARWPWPVAQADAKLEHQKAGDPVNVL